MVNPLQVLPDGTIISGHQRVRAAKLLGWSHIEAVVRHLPVVVDQQSLRLGTNGQRDHQVLAIAAPGTPTRKPRVDEP